jgi:hypothetical protein
MAIGIMADLADGRGRSWACLALLLGPLVEPPLVSLGCDTLSQTLLSNIYKGIIMTFQQQMLVLGGKSALALAPVTLWYRLLRHYQQELAVTLRK